MRRALVLIIGLLTAGSTNLVAQTHRHPVVVSPLIGDTLDVEERDALGLFPEVEGFRRAVFYGINNGGSVEVEIYIESERGSKIRIMNMGPLRFLQERIEASVRGSEVERMLTLKNNSKRSALEAGAVKVLEKKQTPRIQIKTRAEQAKKALLSEPEVPTNKSSDEVILTHLSLGGPRLGVTYFSRGTNLVRKPGEKENESLVSQFGWHFEYQVIPVGGGPQFVVQFVPLIAGVEYGTLLPSGTLALGVRFPNGFEFGLGPNALMTDKGISTSLVMTVGRSFNYGGVSIPVDFVYAGDLHGSRYSIIFGYAITKAR